MSYWDTSALVKLYAIEPDSGDFIARSLAAPPLHTCRLAEYELRATLRRKEAEGVLTAGATESFLLEFQGDHLLDAIVIHEESDATRAIYEEVLEKCYTQSPPVFVRTADAIHIATALAVGEQDFITADARQRRAAEVCGLTVQP